MLQNRSAISTCPMSSVRVQRANLRPSTPKCIPFTRCLPLKRSRQAYCINFLMCQKMKTPPTRTPLHPTAVEQSHSGGKRFVSNSLYHCSMLLQSAAADDQPGTAHKSGLRVVWSVQFFYKCWCVVHCYCRHSNPCLQVSTDRPCSCKF